MKVATWNCNGAFRKKFNIPEIEQNDIVVIQECEDPARSTDVAYKNWAKNALWVGENKHKGLGIFFNEHIKVELNPWDSNQTKYFISARINDSFDLIAVWNHHANSPTFGYIGQFWKYLQTNKTRMKNVIILGDFNSNKIWDKWNRWWNHSDVVRELNEIGIRSLYHEHYKIEQGVEPHPTFYLQRNLAKPYHIDYIFASHSVVFSINGFNIGDSTKWLALSDHLPDFRRI